MLTGDAMLSTKLLLTVETYVLAWMSDLHLVAASANFVCSV